MHDSPIILIKPSRKAASACHPRPQGTKQNGRIKGKS
jgi:hypothetical protein